VMHDCFSRLSGAHVWLQLQPEQQLAEQTTQLQETRMVSAASDRSDSPLRGLVYAGWAGVQSVLWQICYGQASSCLLGWCCHVKAVLVGPLITCIHRASLPSSMRFLGAALVLWTLLELLVGVAACSSMRSTCLASVVPAAAASSCVCTAGFLGGCCCSCMHDRVLHGMCCDLCAQGRRSWFAAARLCIIYGLVPMQHLLASWHPA
jgi:hypothetical protein